jgi:hypothetical protein
MKARPPARVRRVAMTLRRLRPGAARAGLFAWTLGFLLAPLVHLWAHRADHHHHGEGVRWILATPAHDHPHAHADAGPEAARPEHTPETEHALDHADGAGHLHAAVLTPPWILPLFEGRLPAHTSPAQPLEAPATARLWLPQHPRAPPTV